MEQLFIICAPAAFLAFNYIAYGRLILYIGAEHSVVKPQKIAKIFVISDISTFLLQVRINVLSWVGGCSRNPLFERLAEAVLRHPTK